MRELRLQAVLGQAVVDKGAFRRPLEDARVDQQPQVAADARLALADHAADLGDGQLLTAQQRHEAQARRLGDRAQRTDELVKAELAGERVGDVLRHGGQTST